LNGHRLDDKFREVLSFATNHSGNRSKIENGNRSKKWECEPEWKGHENEKKIYSVYTHTVYSTNKTCTYTYSEQ
jgi:hypothetical protein